MKKLKNEIESIAYNQLEIKLRSGWDGIDPVMPILNKIKDEDGIVIIKLDGERNFNTKNESGPFTTLISNGKLKNNYIKYELWSLEESVYRAIIEYNDLFWKTK